MEAPLEAKLVPIDAISIVLIIAAIASAVLAVRFKEMLFSAISLAVLSVMIAIIFFKLDSPYAGVFELSICAGLITALFVSVISLTKRK
ncbi:MAG: hypothetical protein SU899_01755 [Chloroflexota bacterium]|nr:hypothetical protein [Chloroflexota bacterium]